MSSTSIYATRGVCAPQRVVNDLESAVGKMPVDYREFLLDGDGARLAQFNSVIGSEFGGVREIFALADPNGSYRKLPHVIKMYHNRVPNGYLPIADDQAGNLYCLALVGSPYGKVYFWDHEFESEEDDNPTMANMHLVAASFTDLMNRVRIDDD